LVDLAKVIKNAVIINTKGKANSLTASLLKLDKPFETEKHGAFFVAIGDDEPSERLLKNLEGAPFLAVAASYHSKLTARADVVIPVEMWAEISGHYINLDGRVQKTEKALNRPAGVLSTVELLSAIAKGLDLKTKDGWKESIKSRVSSAAIVEA